MALCFVHSTCNVLDGIRVDRMQGFTDRAGPCARSLSSFGLTGHFLEGEVYA